MNPTLVIQILLVVLPKLREYFTKNAGLNTVTGGFLGSFGSLLLVALSDTSTSDQLINWLATNGKWGLIAAGILFGARSAWFFVKGGWSKVVVAATARTDQQNT